MYRLFIPYLFFLCLLVGEALSQARVLEAFYNSDRLNTTTYKLLPDQIVLKTEFGESVPHNPEIIRKVTAADVKQVDLIYTDYPKGQNFDQLNKNRLNELKKLLPELFQKNGIKWRMIRQTDCQTQEEAKSMFHGFVFSMEQNTISLSVDYNKNLNQFKKIYFDLSPEDRRFLSIGDDTLSYDILERNLHNWGRITVVSDWTASMYPFTTQILRWHLAQMGESNIYNFVFFNDGDSTKNSDKKIGQTGGIYNTSSQNLMEVIELMKKVMANGDGDDLPENDIEALLFAMNNIPDTDDYVLIADSRSAVRDLSLISQIKHPVRVLLGRVFKDEIAYIRGDYIRLALMTGGSLHTRYHDYTTPEQLLQLRDDVLKARQILRSKKNKNFR